MARYWRPAGVRRPVRQMRTVPASAAAPPGEGARDTRRDENLRAQLAYLARRILREPYVIVRPHRNSGCNGTRRGDKELDEATTVRRDPPDLIAIRLREPEIAVGTDHDMSRVATAVWSAS